MLYTPSVPVLPILSVSQDCNTAVHTGSRRLDRYFTRTDVTSFQTPRSPRDLADDSPDRGTAVRRCVPRGVSVLALRRVAPSLDTQRPSRSCRRWFSRSSPALESTPVTSHRQTTHPHSLRSPTRSPTRSTTTASQTTSTRSLVIDDSDPDRETLIVRVDHDDAAALADEVETFCRDRGAHTEREVHDDADVRVLATLE